jgi:hypothetical protein
VRRGGPAPVIVVDLDYTLYNNDPRMAQVIREWAASDAAAAFPEVRAVLARFEEKNVRYSLADCLRATGVSADTTAAVMKALLPFFLATFFDNEHTTLDSVIEDVRALLTKLTDAGARIAFLTGRLETKQGAGTRAALARDGFAIDDTRYFLFLKPTDTRSDGSKYADADYKHDVKPQIEALGTVVATLDNEPANVVGFASTYPNAMNVFVDTKWSDEKVAPGDGLYYFAPRRQPVALEAEARLHLERGAAVHFVADLVQEERQVRFDEVDE